MGRTGSLQYSSDLLIFRSSGSRLVRTFHKPVGELLWHEISPSSLLSASSRGSFFISKTVAAPRTLILVHSSTWSPVRTVISTLLFRRVATCPKKVAPPVKKALDCIRQSLAFSTPHLAVTVIVSRQAVSASTQVHMVVPISPLPS